MTLHFSGKVTLSPSSAATTTFNCQRCGRYNTIPAEPDYEGTITVEDLPVTLVFRFDGRSKRYFIEWSNVESTIDIVGGRLEVKSGAGVLFLAEFKTGVFPLTSTGAVHGPSTFSWSKELVFRRIWS
jgi:hypothetical protein